MAERKYELIQLYYDVTTIAVDRIPAFFGRQHAINKSSMQFMTELLEAMQAEGITEEDIRKGPPMYPDTQQDQIANNMDKAPAGGFSPADVADEMGPNPDETEEGGLRT